MSGKEFGWRQVIWPLCLVSIVGVLLHIPSLRFGFVYDDHLLIEDNPSLRIWPGFTRVFLSEVLSLTGYADSASNYYRPLMWVAYNTIFTIAGATPWVFHLANLLVHGAVVAVMFLLSLEVWKDRRIATTAALLFAVHPAHVEAVAWIAALLELSFSLCFLMCLYFYVIDHKPEHH